LCHDTHCARHIVPRHSQQKIFMITTHVVSLQSIHQLLLMNRYSAVMDRFCVQDILWLLILHKTIRI